MRVAIDSDAVQRIPLRTNAADHVFFTGMGIAMAVVVGAGFSRTYFQRIAEGSATPLIHIHGAVFACWMLLFIAQTALVGTGHTRLHRRVGVGGVFFAALMLMIGAVTAVIAARHGYHGNPPGPLSPLAFLLAAPLRDMLVFGSLTGAAIVLSRNVQSHKRLMTMATLGGLVPAGLSRLTNGATPAFFLIFLAWLLAGPAYDWFVHRRVCRAYVWGVAVTILTTGVFTLLSDTAAWQSFAQTLIQ